MKYENEYLRLLIGKRVVNVDWSTDLTISREKDKQTAEHIISSEYVQLFIEEYRLNINNPYSIMPEHIGIADLIGLIVVSTVKRDFDAEIVFDNGCSLIIDMRDEVYTDPEAMVLYCPGFWAVWN